MEQNNSLNHLEAMEGIDIQSTSDIINWAKDTIKTCEEWWMPNAYTYRMRRGLEDSRQNTIREYTEIKNETKEAQFSNLNSKQVQTYIENAINNKSITQIENILKYADINSVISVLDNSNSNWPSYNRDWLNSNDITNFFNLTEGLRNPTLTQKLISKLDSNLLQIYIDNALNNKSITQVENILKYADINSIVSALNNNNSNWHTFNRDSNLSTLDKGNFFNLTEGLRNPTLTQKLISNLDSNLLQTYIDNALDNKSITQVENILRYADKEDILNYLQNNNFESVINWNWDLMQFLIQYKNQIPTELTAWIGENKEKLKEYQDTREQNLASLSREKEKKFTTSYLSSINDLDTQTPSENNPFQISTNNNQTSETESSSPISDTEKIQTTETENSSPISDTEKTQTTETENSSPINDTEKTQTTETESSSPINDTEKTQTTETENSSPIDPIEKRKISMLLERFSESWKDEIGWIKNELFILIHENPEIKNLENIINIFFEKVIKVY